MDLEAWCGAAALFPVTKWPVVILPGLQQRKSKGVHIFPFLADHFSVFIGYLNNQAIG